MYVGRASHEGDQITAKVMPCKKAAYVSYNGVEIFKQNFEVLVGTGFKWVAANNGQTPAGAVSSGKTSCGEALYIGR